MYPPSSPALSSFDGLLVDYQASQCLKFKFFATFLICSVSVGLLGTSLATHSWLIAHPIRTLPVITNSSSLANNNHHHHHYHQQYLPNSTNVPLINADNKFQGEVYFGLFAGVKKLNYGFGDRIFKLSLINLFFTSNLTLNTIISPLPNNFQQSSATNHLQYTQLINFKLWLITIAGVLLAIGFGMLSVVLSIVNFVVEPEAKVNGPHGLVAYNAISAISCAASLASWLVEFKTRLSKSVLTNDDIVNGWSSENKAALGFSYYLVLIAFISFIVNIIIVTTVHTKSLSSQQKKTRQVCEGVIMLY